jgi:hypothetical protein
MGSSRMTERGIDFDRLPGGKLIRQGLEDLRAGRESVAALLVRIGAPRLRRIGLAIEALPDAASPERRLYERLASEDPDTAHSRYNAFLRLLVSFERTAECDSPR